MRRPLPRARLTPPRSREGPTRPLAQETRSPRRRGRPKEANDQANDCSYGPRSYITVPLLIKPNMSQQDRDRGGRDAADPRRLTDRARPDLFELLDDLVRQSRNSPIVDLVGHAHGIGAL